MDKCFLKRIPGFEFDLTSTEAFSALFQILNPSAARNRIPVPQFKKEYGFEKHAPGWANRLRRGKFSSVTVKT